MCFDCTIRGAITSEDKKEILRQTLSKLQEMKNRIMKKLI
jgi:hypothetical protein